MLKSLQKINIKKYQFKNSIPGPKNILTEPLTTNEISDFSLDLSPKQ